MLPNPARPARSFHKRLPKMSNLDLRALAGKARARVQAAHSNPQTIVHCFASTRRQINYVAVCWDMDASGKVTKEITV